MRLHVGILDEERRWNEIEAALGAIGDHGHEWDEDPAAWVSRGRRENSRPLQPRDFPMDELEVEDWPVG